MLRDAKGNLILSMRRKWSARLSEEDTQKILSYVRGAVDSICNTSQSSTNFSASSFAGSLNKDWRGTDLFVFFDYHYNHGSKSGNHIHDAEFAKRRAGQDLGYFLKKVLIEDNRHSFIQTDFRFNGARQYMLGTHD